MDAWLEQPLKNVEKGEIPPKGHGKGKGSSTGKTRKVKAQSSSSDARSLESVILAVGDLALETASKDRLLGGSLMRAFLVQPNPIFDKPLNVTSTVTDIETRYPAAWAALVAALTTLPINDQNAEYVKILKAHCDKPFQNWAHLVHMCRVAETYDKQFIKVQFWCNSELNPASKAVSRILLSLGAEIKWGAPPRTAKERHAAQCLTNLRKSSHAQAGQ